MRSYVAGAYLYCLTASTAALRKDSGPVKTETDFTRPDASTSGGCAICNVAESLHLAADPLIGPISATQQVTAMVQWSDGSTTDVTSQTPFSSSAANIISVQDTPGASGNGLATFAAVGNAIIKGSFTFAGGSAGEPG